MDSIGGESLLSLEFIHLVLSLFLGRFYVDCAEGFYWMCPVVGSVRGGLLCGILRYQKCPLWSSLLIKGVFVVSHLGEL